MEISSLLTHIGLSDHESALYLALVESGPATVAELARRTTLHRPAIYKTLPSLVEQGLVTKGPHGKRTLYIAEPPEKLELLLERVRCRFEDMMPELTSAYHAAGKRPLVKLYEGRKGITAVFEDLVTTLGRGEMSYRYSSARDLRRANSYLPTDYREKRDNKQLERLVITSESQSSKKQPRLERDIKTVPASFDLFDDDITQLIYAHKVAFIDYNSETAIVVENKTFATFQKKLFMLLWRGL